MSNHRAAFILTGGGLLTLAILGFTAREFQLGPFAARLAEWSPMVAYGTFAAAALLGALLLVFAPSSRRVENRVKLDRPDAQNPVMARPSTSSGVPTTTGMASDSGATARRKTANSVHGSKAAESADGRPRATPSATAGATAPGWAHPNDAGHDATPAAPAPAPAATARATPAPRQPDHAPTHAPAGADDPTTLRARLAELDRQANHAKVRYGLGQLSPNGYRAVLDKLNKARAQIEETLLGDLQV